VKVFDTPSRIIVTCNMRVTPFLEQEIVALGFNPVQTFKTGVELRGTVRDCIRLNLNLRCASQVLYSLKTFSANSPEHVYKTLVAYPWETLIPKDGYLTVTSYADHFTVNNSMFVNVKVKDAIADRMLRETTQRPDSGPAGDHTVIHLYWKEDRAEVFIDTAGETLGKHGYRKIPGKAPMLEALVSATLMASKWDRKSVFINPMCGSSTIAIEAVLLATNRRPGLFRNNYSFMHILGYNPEFYQHEYRQLKELIVEVPSLRVIATDISDDAIEISRVNAADAGVERYIEFNVCDFESTEIPDDSGGVVYLNPEYGERLGEYGELEETYARIGDFLKKKCKGYTGYIFTGNMELAKKIGLKASRRIEFFNSQIDCRLLEYELYSGTRKKQKVGSQEE